MAKRIIVSVTNDLSTDQRVAKTCKSLQKLGFDIILVGRMLKNSLPVDRPYPTHRMRLAFNRGPLFYIEYNIRLFVYLIQQRPDILLANDLDTLLANYLAYTSFSKVDLIYDSHEYFTEVPELKGRWARKAWLLLENWIFPKLKRVYTVNRSIAEIYRNKYGVDVKVVHNFPEIEGLEKLTDRAELGLPLHKKIIIMQGAGLNLDRGGEEAVNAMRYLSEDYFLVVVGAGDRIEAMKHLARSEELKDKIRFEPKMPYKEMMQFTFNADLGLNLDKGDSQNYIYALPNKVVDYMAAGIPVLNSDMHESRRFVEEKAIGLIIDEVTPKKVAQGIEKVFAKKETYEKWKKNALIAKKTVNWAHEEKIIHQMFSPLV
ncbi:MAG: glycosyltransferase [Flavobacteriales bacterium]|nr:glycosyltransferase [Flavobacteriales bacterium]